MVGIVCLFWVMLRVKSVFKYLLVFALLPSWILLPTHGPHTLLSVHIQYEIPRAIIQPCILTNDRKWPNNSTSDKLLTLLSFSCHGLDCILKVNHKKNHIRDSVLLISFLSPLQLSRRDVGEDMTWQPTPLFLPGEACGRRSLVGCCPWGRRAGHTCSDLACMHALEKEMATLSSILAWRIPGTEEPGRLLSMGSHRVRHDWNDLAAAKGAGEMFVVSEIPLKSDIDIFSISLFPLDQHFWHQGPASWKTVFPWTRVGGWFGDDLSALHLLCTFFYYSYSSSTSDH